MHLDIAHVYRVHISMSHDSIEYRQLIAFMRSGYGICLATMICGRSGNDSKDRVVIRLCILEPFENHRPDSIRSTVPTGGVIKRIAIPFKNA